MKNRKLIFFQSTNRLIDQSLHLEYAAHNRDDKHQFWKKECVK